MCSKSGCGMGFFFFFSSRRRHTRWNCDWSSDVCSSDLELAGVAPHDEIDGRSMAPLLRSDPPPPEDWRQAYLLEHTEEKTHRLREGSLLFRAPPHTLEPPDPQ